MYVWCQKPWSVITCAARNCLQCYKSQWECAWLEVRARAPRSLASYDVCNVMERRDQCTYVQCMLDGFSTQVKSERERCWPFCAFRVILFTLNLVTMWFLTNSKSKPRILNLNESRSTFWQRTSPLWKNRTLIELSVRATVFTEQTAESCLAYLMAKIAVERFSVAWNLC